MAQAWTLRSDLDGRVGWAPLRRDCGRNLGVGRLHGRRPDAMAAQAHATTRRLRCICARVAIGKRRQYWGNAKTDESRLIYVDEPVLCAARPARERPVTPYLQRPKLSSVATKGAAPTSSPSRSPDCRYRRCPRPVPSSPTSHYYWIASTSSPAVRTCFVEPP